MISFVVPVKNGLSLTQALVDSVHRTNPDSDIEWVIVDSGSTDGTQDWAKRSGHKLVDYRCDTFNYCRALNLGATAATGDLWLFANNDLEFRSNHDLRRVEHAFAAWPLLAVMSPGREKGEGEFEFSSDLLNGCCWAVRPQTFRDWGGMPEALSGYGFDELWTVIQCWRRGSGIGRLTRWDVFHHGSATFGPLGGTVTAAMRRNLSRLLRVCEAQDLDQGWNWYRIVEALLRRERRMAPSCLRVPRSWQPHLERQGWVNAQPHADSVTPRLGQDPPKAVRHQLLPWLANELQLQPLAPAVGIGALYAVRSSDFDAPTAVGPPPPLLLPPLPPHRVPLKARFWAMVNDFRRRGQSLPDSW